jgi:mRNA interferase RelE/StbE
MIVYEKEVAKAVKKGLLQENIFKTFHHAFQALELTKDMNLFDIKRLKGSHNRNYFRLRKGKYRAIFYIEDGTYVIISISKREEAYNS